MHPTFSHDKQGRGVLSRKERQILRLLTRAAATGEPCPKNQQLATACGFSVGRASHSFVMLEKAGAILVERMNNSRVVTIAATGKSTKYNLHRGSAGRVIVKPEIVGQRVADRTPCPRCATRGDLWCPHKTSYEARAA